MAEGRKRVRGVSPVIQQCAKDLRRRMTPAEKVLWAALRGHQLAGIGFRRQYPTEGFVVDFCAPSYRLVVEVDGDIHDEQQEHDAEREAFLRGNDYQVIRFRNEEVLQQLDTVLERIRHQALLHPKRASSETE